MDIAVIGAGRVGTALAVLWQREGHRIVAVAGGAATPERAARFLPGVPVRADDAAASGATVVVIATPDAVIDPVCHAMAEAGALGAATAVVHASGATGLDALAPAAALGAATLSVHPLQTCPTVESAIERIPGAAFAVTALDDAGYALGERLARDAGGRPFRIADDLKPLYHAAAVFASNYLVTVSAIAEELERAAGLDDPLGALAPLQAATLANVERVGPASALTGPAVRGDAVTVRRNLEALEKHAPEAVRPYVALADLALALAERSGRLLPDGREAVEEELARWR
ncbi:MAG TPA: Rossmann-like and DUF2520 domain-containing protein [Actinomycetota bacterium]|nr:Rossmann-like and DUF2520 domain-containing protein [Actinomycetota bacterium]